jgi:dynein heavy chain
LSHNDSNIKKVKVEIINPKALSLFELYGVSKDVSWDEGVIEIVMERAIKSEENCRHWILFDGPVDAVWIESMNTVLDDNKKLCLSSGKVLLLS